MKKLAFTTLTLLLMISNVRAQIDQSLLKETQKSDSLKNALNMDAVQNRIYVTSPNTPVSIGGYIEGDYKYIGEDGLTEGHTFSVPRVTLLISSSIHSRIKFMSELEIEEGGEEIAIEFAAIDVNFHPLFNLRGGVIMNPIGAFNQNHDGPKWEFVDRPIAMTQMLPATWSNVGFGLFGKMYKQDWLFGYEAYLTNGFDNSIIGNSENRTFLPASKKNKERFEESSNGEPLFTGKVALRNQKFGELGLSYMGGIYNTHEDDGLVLDDPRRLDVFAIDFTTEIAFTKTLLVGEWAWIFVDVPETFTQKFGDRKQGGFLDVVQPILEKPIFGFENAILNVALRFESVDWNVGTFNETGGNIGDELWAIVPGISFRPTRQTVFRLNYMYQEQTDLLGNPPAKISGVEVGFASYF